MTYVLPRSPSLNQNLLTRSEVVALINTMHRFAESLYFVNNFRKMWADAAEDESEQLIGEARKAVREHVSSSDISLIVDLLTYLP